MLGAESDLILIALVAALGLTVQRYHLPALARRLVALVTPALEPSIAAGLQPLVAKLAGAFLLAGTGLAATAAMRRPVREFGLGVGLPRRWLVDTGISFAVLLPLIAWAASLPSFRHSYPYFAVMRVSAGWFAAGLTVRLAYMFAWEFLFRGLILFGFERRAGPAAGIAASTLPFVLMHFGKPGIEVYSSAAAGVVLGIIALRGRSFLPCWLLHFAAAATLDLLTLAR
jgi:membrane protease YdiL (CAAX protease family)